jgi:uncharacterized membrane protein YraQ (UPF0718 family)
MLNASTLLPHLASLRRAAICLGALVLALALWITSGLGIPAELTALRGQLQSLVTIFLGIFIEALPFLLAGVLASSAIHLFISPDRVRQLCPQNPLLAALSGSLLGLAFPVCECGSVPTARRLLAKGAPLPLGLAFVLAAPAVNPVVIASTWVAFGGRPEIVAARIGLTIVIAAAVGIILGVHPRPGELLAAASQAHHHDDHDHSHDQDAGEERQHWLHAILAHANSEYLEMGRYLVVGALIAATLQTIIPRSLLLSLGQDRVVSIVALMALAVVLSICSTVDAFVALSFATIFMPGALLAFLVFGPMVDIKSVLMFSSIFRPRVVAAMVLLTAQIVLLAGVMINLYL